MKRVINSPLSMPLPPHQSITCGTANSNAISGFLSSLTSLSISLKLSVSQHVFGTWYWQ